MKRIVSIRRGGIGDFIAGAVPVCEYFQKQYGKCEFHFFMTKSNIGIAKYFYPDACTYLVPDHNRLYNHTRLGLINRGLKPDIGFIGVPNFPRFDSLFLYCIGAQERYGRIGGSKVAQLLLNHASQLYTDVDHSPDHVGLCGLRIVDSKIDEIENYYLPKFRTELLKVFKPINSGPYIMVEVSNNRDFSQLPIKKMAKVLNELYTKYRFSILITGKMEHKGRTEELELLLTMPCQTFISSSLDEFLSFVNAADIVLCGDGGLGHIAGSMNKNIVAVYGQTSVSHWGILGGKVSYLYDREHVKNLEDKDIQVALSEFLKLY